MAVLPDSTVGGSRLTFSSLITLALLSSRPGPVVQLSELTNELECPGLPSERKSNFYKTVKRTPLK